MDSTGTTRPPAPPDGDVRLEGLAPPPPPPPAPMDAAKALAAAPCGAIIRAVGGLVGGDCDAGDAEGAGDLARSPGEICVGGWISARVGDSTPLAPVGELWPIACVGVGSPLEAFWLNPSPCSGDDTPPVACVKAPTGKLCTPSTCCVLNGDFHGPAETIAGVEHAATELWLRSNVGDTCPERRAPTSCDLSRDLSRDGDTSRPSTLATCTAEVCRCGDTSRIGTLAATCGTEISLCGASKSREITLATGSASCDCSDALSRCGDSTSRGSGDCTS